jgi:hypothetical protein
MTSQHTVSAPTDAEPITFELMGESFTMTPDAATTYRSLTGEWRAMVSGDVVDEDGQPVTGGVYHSFAADDTDLPDWIRPAFRDYPEDETDACDAPMNGNAFITCTRWSGHTGQHAYHTEDDNGHMVVGKVWS